jgi:hypothetical protein
MKKNKSTKTQKGLQVTKPKPKAKKNLIKKPIVKKKIFTKKTAQTSVAPAPALPINPLSPPPQKRTRRTKEELKDVYIDPVEMEALIIKYYETDIISDKLAEMVQMIATRLALARNFYSYSFKSEMQGDAIVKMMTALRRKRFKTKAGYNPFSYFTKVAYHAFQNCIKKSKKDFDTLKRYQEEMFESHMCSNNLPCRKNFHNDSGMDFYNSDNA